MVNKDNKNNNNSSNSLVFGRWPQTKIAPNKCVSYIISHLQNEEAISQVCHSAKGSDVITMARVNSSANRTSRQFLNAKYEDNF